MREVVVKNGLRYYRADNLQQANSFARLFAGRVEHGLWLHRWYVVI